MTGICNNIVVNNNSLLTADVLNQPLDDRELNDGIQQLWMLESVGVKESKFSNEDEIMKENFNNSIEHNNDQYYVTLPWKLPCPQLEDNFKLAKGHLYRNYNKLKNLGKLDDYNNIFKEQLKMNFIEQVENEPFKRDGCHYLTHRAVFRTDSNTTKLRIVYNCSLKGSNSISLNDCLMQGPNLVTDLVENLLNFRLDQFALQSDIEKAFLKVNLKNESDKNHLRFLWYKDPNDVSKGFITFRFNVVLFGSTSSPALLNLTIANHLARYKDTLTVQFLRRSFYVDNLIGSVVLEEELHEIYAKANKIMNEGNFKLREWVSNSGSLNKKIEKDKLGPNANNNYCKTLGINWYLNENCEGHDSVCLKKISLNKEANTKRKILSESAKVFDPLGMFTPLTIQSRILLQEIWEKKYEWDDILPEEIVKIWRKLALDLEKLENTKIPRCTGYRYREHSLQIFVDASMKAYGCCAYLVNENESHLVYTKSKVTPIKPSRTVPQLELLAFTLGMKTAKFLKDAFFEVDITNILLWSDSQVVLSWASVTKSSSCKNVFVKNRILEIEKICEDLKNVVNVQYSYIETKQNPADFLTRGLSYKLLKKNKSWFHGPKWLVGMEMPIGTSLNLNAVQVNQNETEKIESIIDLETTSNYTKAVRITACCYRFISKLRAEPEISRSLAMKKALIYWIKFVQKTEMPDVFDFFSSRKNKSDVIPDLISEFNLFVDKNGVFRCRGRLGKSSLSYECQNPVLLPSKCRFTTLLIRYLHLFVYHMGISRTLTEVRKTYWIPRGRNTVKSVLDQCVTCKKQHSHSFKTPSPPDLPKERVNLEIPFEAIGVDYTGSITVSLNGQDLKMYIVLFTCAASRAIVLDIVEDLTADSFILAFRRFCANYSIPQLVMSDNATYFKSSDGTLQKLFEIPQVQEYLENHLIEWKYIPPKSPWYGSIWERQIKTVKDCIRKSVGYKHLQLFELQTIVTEIQNVVNSRPLTYISEDLNDSLEILTPNMILKGYNISMLPDFEEEDLNDKDWNPSSHEVINIRFRHRAEVNRQFIIKWETEYLTSLREKHKHLNNLDWENCIKIGDVVIIKNDSPRLQWALGRVIDLKPGNDGVVRVATLKTQNGTTVRDITLLYPLECSLQDVVAENENDSHVAVDTPVVSQSNLGCPATPDPPIQQARLPRKAAQKFQAMLDEKIKDKSL